MLILSPLTDNYSSDLRKMSLCARKPTIWVPIRSDTNRLVQSQKQARSLKFWMKKMRDCTIRIAKTKALISFAITMKLIFAFVFAQAKSGFFMARLILSMHIHNQCLHTIAKLLTIHYGLLTGFIMWLLFSAPIRRHKLWFIAEIVLCRS